MPYRLMEDGVTYGALATWLTCREKAYNKYYLGLGTDKISVPMEFGNIVHENLDRVYSAWKNFGPEDRADFDPLAMADVHLRAQEDAFHREAVTTMMHVTDLNKVYEEYQLAGVVLGEYYRAWKSDFGEMDWIALEEVFKIYPAQFNVPLRGKIDGIYRNPSGGLTLMDTKTKSRFNEDKLLLWLPMDLQTSLYSWAAWMMYQEPITEVMYNIVRRPQLRQGVKETREVFLQRVLADMQTRPEWYFSRIYMQVDTASFATTADNAIKTISEFIDWATLIENNDLKANYRNPTACSNGIWDCEFIRFCATKDDDGLYERPATFPELSAPIAIK